MVDLHTHILCGVDDGAGNPEASLQMLRMERDQGVTRVVLTPHFYGERRSPDEFFARRKRAWDHLGEFLDALPARERESLPEMIPGAEVAWRPNLLQWPGIERFCIAGTRNMLLELPAGPWEDNLAEQICDFAVQTGITPILAHMERYAGIQKRRVLREVLSLGLPAQITAEVFLHRATLRRSLRALTGWATVVATDSHGTRSRCPRLGEAMAVIEEKMGKDMADRLRYNAAALLLPE